MTKQKMLKTCNDIMDDCEATNLDTATKLRELSKVVKNLVQLLPDDPA